MSGLRSGYINAVKPARRVAARVFEFGAGASTVWQARRAAEVHSVEHDAGFGGHVRELVTDRPGVDLRIVPPTSATAATVVRSGRHEHLDFGDYVSAIDAVGVPFDLVVMDGRARVDSFRRALAQLAPDGVIVFDNVRRKRYQPAVQTPGLTVTYLRGATPALPSPATTGLVRRA